MRLTKANYHSNLANIEFMSYSQFKDFLKCPAMAMAKLSLEYQPTITDSLMVGSYVDAWLDGELDKFKAENPEMFLKSGELKAAFRKADELCKLIADDKFLYKFLKVKRQKILTCNIAGVQFKVKIDSLHKDKIVDGKVLKDLDDVWNDGYKPFYYANRYDLQGAIYQLAVEQNFGVKLPFYLACVTKEPTPNKDIFKIKQSAIDDALQEVINLAPQFQSIKEGKLEAWRCEDCEFCRKTKKLSFDKIKEV